MVDPTAILTVIALGLVYGLTGYVTKRDEGERLKFRKLIRTLIIWTVSAVAVFYGGQAVSEQAVQTEAATGVGVTVAVLFDMIWSALRNRGVLPTWLTGPIEPPE